MRKWLNAEIALGFLVATVFWTVVIGWQAAYAPTEREKQACYEAAQKSGHKSEECKSLWERTTSDPVAFFTLWIALFTASLVGATYALFRAGEKQRLLAEDTAKRQLRAYLSLKLTKFNISRHGGKFFCDARYDIMNTGQTPAYDVEQFVAFKILPWPLPEDLVVPSPTKTPVANRSAINPHQITEGASRQLVAMDVDTLRKNGERIYFLGVLKFIDAFNKAQQVRFCGSFENTIELLEACLTGKTGNLPTIFSWGQQHNDAS